MRLATRPLGEQPTMTNEKSDQTPERATNPGVTTFGDGQTTTDDKVAGDLRTETGDKLYAETGQDGKRLEESRPKG
jgi:hypothetical protein